MNSRSTVLYSLVILTIAAMAPIVRGADDKATEEQYLALAAQRTKAELAVRKAMQVFDQSKSGWNETSQAINDVHQKINTTFQKAVQTEQQKPEAERNQALVDEINAMVQQNEQDWQTFARDQQTANNAYNAAGQVAQNTRSVYDNLVQVERPWKESGMDLAPLGANFDLVVRNMDALTEKGQNLIDHLKAVQKEWEGKLAAATKAVAPGK